MRGLQLILVAAAVAIGVAVLVKLRLVVVPVLIAVTVAAAVWPLVGRLRRRGVPHLLAAWVALLAGGAALGAMSWLVVAGVRGQMGRAARPCH